MLIKLYRSAAHFMIFAMGLRLLASGEIVSGDAAALAVAALVCVALLVLWRRALSTRGHDPELVAQVLLHGLAIITAVLATRALAQFMQGWVAALIVAIAAAIAAIAFVAARFQQRGEAPWKYSGMALGSVSLMGLLAAGLLR